MTDLFLPLILACTAGYALHRRVDLFPTLLCGVKGTAHGAAHFADHDCHSDGSAHAACVGICRPDGTGMAAAVTADRHSGGMHDAAFAQANQRKRRAGARTGHYAHLRRRQRAGKNRRGNARRVRNEFVYHQCVLRVFGTKENTVRHSRSAACRFCRFCLRGVVCSHIVLTGENG